MLRRFHLKTTILLSAFVFIGWGMSSLAGANWKPFQKHHSEVGSYCAANLRSGLVLQDLAKRDFQSVSAKLFRTALESTVHPQYPNLVLLRTREQYQDILYKGGGLFLSRDRKAGFAIMADGELVSLFNNGNEKGIGARAVKAAIQMGADHLFCWGDGLASYYEQFGFQVVKVSPWDEEKWIDDIPPADPKPKLYYMRIDAPFH